MDRNSCHVDATMTAYMTGNNKLQSCQSGSFWRFCSLNFTIPVSQIKSFGQKTIIDHRPRHASSVMVYGTGPFDVARKKTL